MLGVDPTIDITGFVVNENGLIHCNVSDMPSTGSVSTFYSLSVFLNFSCLLKFGLRKAILQHILTCLVYSGFFAGYVLLLFLLIGPHKIIPSDKSEKRLQC